VVGKLANFLRVHPIFLLRSASGLDVRKLSVRTLPLNRDSAINLAHHR